jgi:hypothetical protein
LILLDPFGSKPELDEPSGGIKPRRAACRMPALSQAGLALLAMLESVTVAFEPNREQRATASRLLARS